MQPRRNHRNLAPFKPHLDRGDSHSNGRTFDEQLSAHYLVSGNLKPRYVPELMPISASNFSSKSGMASE